MTRPVRLIAIRYLSPDVSLFEFESINRLPFEACEAGRPVDRHGRLGAWARPYSLASVQASPVRVIGVRREKARGSASAYLHDKARVGEHFALGEGRCLFPLDEDAPHSVLIAGGIGITPLLSMVDRLASLRASWALHYASRDEPAPFRKKLLPFSERVHHYRGSGALSGRLDIAAVVAGAPPGTVFYCCGPTRMVEAFNQVTGHLPEGHARIERFTAEKSASVEGGFVVVLAQRGIEIPVPAGSTILEALRTAGIDAPSSCQQGICGVCETGVREGRPDHRDGILTVAERASNRTMMICCSGSLDARLVLDL